MNEVEKINIICDKQITNNDININLYDIIIEYNYFDIINVVGSRLTAVRARSITAGCWI